MPKSTTIISVFSWCFAVQAAIAQPGAAPIQANVSSSTLHGGVTHKTYQQGTAAGFLTTTTSGLDGYKVIEYKGLVEGAAVRVPTWAEDSSAGMQEVQGGKIDAYTTLCEEARVQAFTTLVDRAKELNANAVIGIHFDSQVMPLDKGRFASGVVCVGTAVVVRKQ